ncbi:MAG: aminoacyl-histidine dipeptidase [Bacteroidales bacterium]|nr:aminoacyl-histidine dipeptidase [Bacteroidales bacterium]MCI7377867.1 aminoacyl-histidine dipeptidase [Bacteroidales bacterium]MDD5979117.1 aminoacyl-histidine dipeptidase [Bacteroidales bacterium]MDD7276365.1 aminoacyl-histidine dipeptidase [Bacteroidales bacterium]MDY6074542.1 aminoacyl-histidine dipeptidase [Bacteroidales bacterium]
MNEILTTLKPEGVWKEFQGITCVPRPSKKEAKMVAYLEQWAINHNVKYIKEECGNIIMSVPATKGMEDRQTIILQAHMDMVCEKNSDKVHDFENDPIEAVLKGEWLYANGTTLGADDGIGVAAALAVIADPTVQHGPIECIFTIDEETGLTGAEKLDPKDFSGRILLNLDSEDEGEIFIGCAGGMDTIVKIFYKLENAPQGYVAYDIKVNGLKGGHSGDDINKNLANANKLLTRLLWQATNDFDLRVYDIQGGNLRNAIAREATATAFIPEECTEDFVQFVAEMQENFRNEYHIAEPSINVSAEKSAVQPDVVIDELTQYDLLNSLLCCPHGVIEMSQTIPNFVETSTNLASVKRKEGYFFIQTSQRSSIESAKVYVGNMVEACFNLANAEVKHTDGYPGWTPNPDSVICDIAAKCYSKRFGKEPKVKAIHAGLECGLIGDKIAGMDMISFGPTLRGVHSPEERIEIATVQKFWDLLCDILLEAPKK